MTTPLEREILTHHWVTAEPYGEGRTLSKLHHEIMDRFVDAGLLVRLSNGDTEGNYEALSLYMQALADVPLPTKEWAIPRASQETTAP